MKYDQVVSLGGWCQVAYQIKRALPGRPTGPFDWLVTPYQALLATLDDKGARIGSHVRLTDDGTEPLCEAYGLLYPHEFPRDASNNAVITDEAAVACREKMERRFRRLDESLRAGVPTLFIRFGTFAEKLAAWPYFAEQATFTRDDAARFCDRIETLYPDLPYHVAFVHHPDLMPAEPWDDKRSALYSLGPVSVSHLAGANQWRGHDGQWDELFERLGVFTTAL